MFNKQEINNILFYQFKAKIRKIFKVKIRVIVERTRFDCSGKITLKNKIFFIYEKYSLSMICPIFELSCL